MSDISRTFRFFYSPGSVSFDKKTAEASGSILEYSRNHSIPLRSDCGGIGSCGCCRVKLRPAVQAGLATDKEKNLLSTKELESGMRLACETVPLGPVEIELPPTSIERNEASDKTSLKSTFATNPCITRTIFKPGQHENAATASPTIPEISTTLSEKTSKEFENLAAKNSEITVVSHSSLGVTALFSGEHTRSLGLAFDIGTTTIAGYLIDLCSGKVLASSSAANPQRVYGEDVISRIAYCENSDTGLATLQKALNRELNDLIKHSLTASGEMVESIDEVNVVGNTAMQHIFTGLHPGTLGVSPYCPVTRAPMDITAGKTGLELASDTNIHVFPVISGFVGGDTIAAILADGLHERRETTLLIDIGTNGEIVLGNREKIWTTSCATGPAFEGAHISSGMRTQTGAIRSVYIDPEDFLPYLRVIGPQGTIPTGLCGSGIIDSIAAMLDTGIIVPNGRLKKGLPGVEIDEKGVGRKFLLTSQDRSSKAVFLSLEDVRQVQLAKAALRTGIELLMEHAGLNSFDRLVLTGAFGERFNWRNAVRLGMLPGLAENTSVEVLVNGAGHGAVMSLCDRKSRETKDAIADMVVGVELADQPAFFKVFTGHLPF